VSSSFFSGWRGGKRHQKKKRCAKHPRYEKKEGDMRRTLKKKCNLALPLLSKKGKKGKLGQSGSTAPDAPSKDKTVPQLATPEKMRLSRKEDQERHRRLFSAPEKKEGGGAEVDGRLSRSEEKSMKKRRGGLRGK